MPVCNFSRVIFLNSYSFKFVYFLPIDLELLSKAVPLLNFRYAEQFNRLTTKDVTERKTINIEILDEPFGNVSKIPINNLSVKLTDVLPSLLHVDLIEQKALHLLNMPKAIVPCPTLEEEKQCKTFMAAREDGTFYTVKVKSNLKVKCDCKGFK